MQGDGLILNVSALGGKKKNNLLSMSTQRLTKGEIFELFESSSPHKIRKAQTADEQAFV